MAKTKARARGMGYSLIVITFSLLVGNLPSAFAAQMVGGAIAQPGAQVAATPISIPRPIRLEKLRQAPAVQHSPVTGNSSQAVVAAVAAEEITGCTLAAAAGNEITLRCQYMINPGRPQPIYAGAWLYDRNRQPIDAGYKPVAIRSVPQGEVDVVLVLPENDCTADYLVAFLMESGRPVFVNGRFDMPYTWKDRTLSGPGIATDSSATSQDATAFCRQYADTALSQYGTATASNLPGIVPPVWSSDYNHHYRWCLTVSRDTANQGTALRQAHLDRLKAVAQPGAASPAANPPAAIQGPALEQASIIKPVANKQLDPGRGP